MIFFSLAGLKEEDWPVVLPNFVYKETLRKSTKTGSVRYWMLYIIDSGRLSIKGFLLLYDQNPCLSQRPQAPQGVFGLERNWGQILNKKHNPPVLLVGPSCAKQVAWW